MPLFHPGHRVVVGRVVLTDSYRWLGQRRGEQKVPAVSPPLLQVPAELRDRRERLGVLHAGHVAGPLCLSPIDRLDIIGGRTDRLTHNCVLKLDSSRSGPIDSRPCVGFSPTKPVHEAGMRIDPPPSLACAIGTIPDATAAAAPPLDPPGVWSVFHGLRLRGGVEPLRVVSDPAHPPLLALRQESVTTT